MAKVGHPAPSFSVDAVLPDKSFSTVSLDQYKGKFVVLFFYPLDFTFVCPTEIIGFSDRIDEFRSINTEVLACSVDSKFSHLAWMNQPRKKGGLGDMSIPILSDIKKEMAEDYGVLIPEDGIALRGLFIIDPKGIIRQITINDLPIGRDVDETLRLVKAIQFTDENGEVCPMGWKPGAKTMVDDPTKSLEYFATVEDRPAKKAKI